MSPVVAGTLGKAICISMVSPFAVLNFQVIYTQDLWIHLAICLLGSTATSVHRGLSVLCMSSVTIVVEGPHSWYKEQQLLSC